MADNYGKFNAFKLSVLTEEELQVLSDMAYVINFQITEPMCEILNFEAYRYRGCIAYSSAQVSLRAKISPRPPPARPNILEDLYCVRNEVITI